VGCTTRRDDYREKHRRFNRWTDVNARRIVPAFTVTSSTNKAAAAKESPSLRAFRRIGRQHHAAVGSIPISVQSRVVGAFLGRIGIREVARGFVTTARNATVAARKRNTEKEGVTHSPLSRVSLAACMTFLRRRPSPARALAMVLPKVTPVAVDAAVLTSSPFAHSSVVDVDVVSAAAVVAAVDDRQCCC